MQALPVADTERAQRVPWSAGDAAVEGKEAAGHRSRKLVGAVTHVLVSNPTTGYGIFIENMLDAAA